MIKNICIVETYIIEDFIPHVWKAIKAREVERKVQKHMGKVISNNILIDLLDSTAKNSNVVRKNIKKPQVQQVSENKKEFQHIKVRMKKQKNKNVQSSIVKYQNNDSQYNMNSGELTNRRKISQNKSLLIKLPEQNEQQSQQIRNIRIMRQRMKKFQKQISQRGEENAFLNSETARKKRSAHSQCIYHTYDYQTNIMEVDPEDLNNFYQNKDNYSLLQSLKKKLDQQIQDSILREKKKSIEQMEKKISFSVPSHKIQKIQNKDGFKKQKLFPQNNSLIKPSVNFEPSYIQSLSKNIEKCIQNGVKMTTNEQKLVEQSQNPEKPSFKLKKQKSVYQKPYSPKQKTNGSQSIIYSLQCNLRSLNIDKQSQKSNKNRSLQLQKDQNISQTIDYYEPIPKKKMTLESPSSFDFKLPEIRFNRNPKRPHKRTSTEQQQKLIKGIDHIHINLSTPQNKSAQENRSELFSLYSLPKKTETSVQQNQSESRSQSNRSKKQLVQEYFNNYGNQFRMRRDNKS